MAVNRRLELSGREYTYLKSADFLPLELAQIISASSPSGDDRHVICLSQDEVELFRDEFTNRLAKVGFDRHYEPTSEGRILEALVDRFYGQG
jgi:hypothetical protein